MATTFATGLSAHLATKKKPTLLQRRLKKVLAAKDSPRKRAILKALETRARDKLRVSATAAIDWGSVDWAKILDFLLKLLMILAPLFRGTPETASRPKATGTTAQWVDPDW